MRIIFLAYRDWALKVFPSVEKHPKVSKIVLCKTQNEFLELNIKKYDLIVTCGWSDELGQEIAECIDAIGVHCAELDRYSYGTPLQLQIMDGITQTKHRIFSFTYDEASKRAHTHNRMYSHEVDLDLSGNMEDILEQMTATSKVLFNRFLDDYPDVTWKKWPSEKLIREKRKPEDSRLTRKEFEQMDTEQLYNFFRCLEAPYPNGYLEDEAGQLFISQVRFKKKK